MEKWSGLSIPKSKGVSVAQERETSRRCVHAVAQAR